MIGKIRYGIIAILIPFLCSVLMVFIYQTSSGEQIETTRGWNALALSTLIDMPVLFIWTLPVLLCIGISWRMFLRVSSASVNFLSSILSSVLWLISSSIFFIAIFRSESFINTVAIGCYFFAIGIFLFWLQQRGSIVISALAMMIIFLCSMLLFGCENMLLNRVFFGSDIKTVEGLFSRDGHPFTVTVFSGAAAFLILSFPLYKFKPKK